MAKKVLKSETYLVPWDRATHEASLAAAKKNWKLHKRNGRYFVKCSPAFSGTFDSLDVMVHGSKLFRGYNIKATIHSSLLKYKVKQD